MNKRKSIIQNLRNNRYSYQQIGNILGVSRQRIHQILTGYISPCNLVKINPIKIKYQYILGKINSKGLSKEGHEGRGYLREIVRRRDNHTCQICGEKWQSGQRRLDVHHLNEKYEGNNGRQYYKNKEFKKMITLCHKCHMNLDSVRRKLASTP